ncbi:MAG: hypothetical protein KatS3mg005_1149 [Bryobacteraceae bacterium]|nr:MAG: hypothetical protein KatS3mg005_1149 [Bryobacteraceae bacterium]
MSTTDAAVGNPNPSSTPELAAQEPDRGASRGRKGRAGARQSAKVLEGLGLYGLEEVEPAILAALATEDPLLLIGPHGTGKSMLLERIAEALGLCFRHYNASLICFDDLIGFPVPEQGSATLKYLQTPATIWDAEAVFFDEVSRCRPDVQNKLFSIIHERKVQGLRLEKLRFRWSAMNPPASAGGTENYSGSQPLDSALADRYAFVVQIPDWNGLGEEAQMKILTSAGGTPEEAAGARLRELLERARQQYEPLRQQLQPLLVDYVRHIALLLPEAGIRLSARRLATLTRNIPAVHAVRKLFSEGTAEAAESFRLALFCSIPSLAEGVPVPRGKLAAAHAQAWKNVSKGKALDLAAILNEPDIAVRATLAARSEALDLQQRSIIVADCMQSLPDGARHALAAYLVEHDLAGRLVAGVAEKVAEEYALSAIPAQGYFETYGGIETFVGKKISRKIAALQGKDPGSQALAQLLTSMFAKNQLKSEAHVDRVCEQWNRTRRTLAQIGGKHI